MSVLMCDIFANNCLVHKTNEVNQLVRRRDLLKSRDFKQIASAHPNELKSLIEQGYIKV
jgi:hypothetical protein